MVDTDVQLLAGYGDTQRRQWVRFGWSDEATEALRNAEFDQLELWAGEKQDMRIPELGEVAHRVERLFCRTPGVVTGLEQFDQLRHLIIDASPPESGMDLPAFPNVESVSMPWDGALVAQLTECRSLRSVSIEGIKSRDLEPLKELSGLA